MEEKSNSGNSILSDETIEIKEIDNVENKIDFKKENSNSLDAVNVQLSKVCNSLYKYKTI